MNKAGVNIGCTSASAFCFIFFVTAFFGPPALFEPAASLVGASYFAGLIFAVIGQATGLFWKLGKFSVVVPTTLTLLYLGLLLGFMLLVSNPNIPFQD